MPRDPSKPTKTQLRLLRRIDNSGPCMMTKREGLNPSYTLIGGKELGQDAVENAIRRGWLVGQPDGLFGGGRHKHSLSPLTLS